MNPEAPSDVDLESGAAAVASRRVPIPRRHLVDAAWLATVFSIAYGTYGLFRHWRFDSSAYDLGIFHQGLWHLSRFEVPGSTVRGISNLLGDHFSPILVLLAPLYWLHDGAETLIVAQAVLLAASIVPVWIYAHRRLTRWPALGVAAAYALFWGIQRTAAFDFHEMAFAPLIVALMILALDDRRWGLFWSMAAALALTKEDLIPLIGGFGLLLLWRRQVRPGIAAIAASVTAFIAIVGYAIPGMNDIGVFPYESAYGDAVRNPWQIPILLVTPLLKVRTMLLLVAPFLFTPLLSPLVILVAPIALGRFLSFSPNHWGTVFHYWAPVAPILAMAAAEGLVRVREWVTARRDAAAGARVVRWCVAGSVVASAFLPGHQPLLRLVRPAHYRLTDVHHVGHSMVALIPPDAAVVAQYVVVPHLSQRDQLFVLDAAAPDADYLIASERLDPWPMTSSDELRALIEQRRAQGYRSIAETDGWVVLQRRR